MGCEARELAPSPPVPVAGKQAWYKLPVLKTMRCHVYVENSPDLEDTKPTRTPRTALLSMGSGSKTVKLPPDAKARIKKRHRKVVLQITSAIIPIDQVGSVFDGLSAIDRAFAFSYYYDHPDELPDRETEAMRRATENPLEVMIKFDLDIFERGVCRHPVPDDEFEELDPFTVQRTPSIRGMSSTTQIPKSGPPRPRKAAAR